MINKEQYPDNLILAVFGELKEYSKSGLENALSTLTEREEEVLRYRFEQGLSLMEVGKIYDITRERIRQIEAKALRKLRHPARADMLLMVSKQSFVELEQKYKKLGHEYYILSEAYAELKGMDAENVPMAARAVLNADKPIEELGLSVRPYNVLNRAGCKTVKDIIKFTIDKLRNLRNMGIHSEAEILEKLHQCGYKLEGE